MKTRCEVADQKFQEGYNCAQSVLYSFCNDLNLDVNTALKLASGFGGGMGRQGEVCGAVTGGILVLGAKYGRGEQDSRDALDLIYSQTRELMNRFSSQHHSCLCRELLNGCDLATNEGQLYFKENDLRNGVCRPCIKDVVVIVETLL